MCTLVNLDGLCFSSHMSGQLVHGCFPVFMFRSLWINMADGSVCTAGSRHAGQRIAKTNSKESLVRPIQSRGLCVSVSASSAAVATEEPETQAKGVIFCPYASRDSPSPRSNIWLNDQGMMRFDRIYAIQSALLLAVEAPVCVVTGSSRGIGRAIALALGATGARVHCLTHTSSACILYSVLPKHAICHAGRTILICAWDSHQNSCDDCRWW